jgi:thioredoxin 1
MGLKIVKFGATWCQPCKVIDSIMESIKKEHSGIEYSTYDHTDDPDMFSKYKITSVPTVILLKDDGTELEKLTGVFPKVKLTLMIEKYNK